MERKQKIQKLLNRLDELEARNPIQSVERLLQEQEDVSRETARETPTGNALKMLARGVDKLQKDPRTGNLELEIKKTRESTKTDLEGLTEAFRGELEGLAEQVKVVEENGKVLSKQQTEEMLGRLAEYQGSISADLGTAGERTNSIAAEVGYLSEEIPKIYSRFDTIPDLTPLIQETAQAVAMVDTKTEGVRSSVVSLAKELGNRINLIPRHGGGNANRNIAIGGNTSVLSTYTDINLIAGANVTLSYQVNQVTKYTDITIAATGGGGGTTREINTVAVSTAAGATAGIDYVYLASGTITITLPTTIGNKNLYTIKNIGSGVVTVNTTGGDTIDGDPTVIMPVRFTSVDLISNSAGNWNIT